MRPSKLCALITLALSPVLVAAQTVTINGQEFTLDPDAPLTIDPATGNVTLSTVEDLSGPDPVAAPEFTTELSFSPALASKGSGDVQVSATYATVGAETCEGLITTPVIGTGLDDWERGWPVQSSNGAVTFTVAPDNISTGAYTLALRCTNSAGSNTSSRQFSITSESTANCSGVAPTNLIQDTRIITGSSATTETYASVFLDFPSSVTENVTILNSRYAALEFTTGDLTSTFVGAVGIGDSVFTPRGPILATISECPGDFGPGLSDACRVLADPTAGGQITYAADPANQFQCDLDSNTTYYLNMVPTLQIPTTTNPQWACGTTAVGGPDTSSRDCSVKADSRLISE